ncbi:unnamed protein product [Moneuplotes crassus]|uniref:Uncharacterized protein n=2 Tax=Euplotes crassus TaxID=5936 RepID=A0AAD1XUZ1_EUPCR|nr:unnamed protein product [Moneuplotes crassus]
MASFDKEMLAYSLINSELYKFLNTISIGYQSKKMAEILKDKKIKSKLSQALSYYTKFTKNGPNKKKIETGQLKWEGDKPIGPTLKEFIFSLSEEWNLDEEITFEVLNGFFFKEKSILKKIDECEKAIKEIKEKVPGRVASYQAQLEDFLIKTKEKLNEFYNKERKSLLKILIFIFVFTSIQDPGSRHPASDILNHLKETNTLKTLVGCLNTNAISQTDQRRDNTQKLENLYQRLEEEEFLLQSIFCFILSDEEKDLDDEKFALFNYFTDSYFQGYAFHKDQDIVVTEEYSKIYQKEHHIRDLIAFMSLICLSVNTKDLKISASLGKTVDAALALHNGTIDTLLSQTAYIVAMSACKNENKDINSVSSFNRAKVNSVFTEKDDKLAIDTIMGLLDSPILEDERYDFIKGSLVNLIKKWIDKAYYIDIINEFGDPEDIRIICFKLIKEPFILKEFWESDYKFNTPFFQLIREGYLLGFPENLLKFCKISLYLTGNKEADFSQYIIDFFRNFDSFVTSLDANYRKSLEGDSSYMRKSTFAGEGEFDFEITKSFEISSGDDIEIYVPEGTKARVFPLRREFYELKIKYDLWPALFSRWKQSILRSGDRDNSEGALRYYKDEIESISSFVSQILLINPAHCEILKIEHDVVSFERNIKTIVNLLLRSLNQIKVLEQILKDDRQSEIEETLRSLSLIISAIGSLYSIPSARSCISECLNKFEKDLIDTEKPYGNTYTVYNHSHHNRLIHLFKELNELEWNYSRGNYHVTKAICGLGPAIMSDPYPSSNLIQILEVIKEIKYRMNRANLEIYLNLLETYKLALQKFQTCPTKANLNLKNVQKDKFFHTIRSFLDDCDIQKILEEVLEIDTNNVNILSEGYPFKSSERFLYINKILKKYQDECTAEDKLIIKSLVLSALECLNIILEMIHTVTIVKKDKNISKMSKGIHQYHMINLRIVNYIKEALLANSSFMTDLEENKILLTVAHYINFESRHSLPTDERKVIHYSCGSLLNASSAALRCLTQIVRIWELSPVSRQISLAPYLSYEDNGFKHSSTMIAKSLSNPEEAHELLNFLICCLNSQTAFINGFFKNEDFFQSIINTFCKHPDRILQTCAGPLNTKAYDSLEYKIKRLSKRVVGMLMILVSELIQNNKVKRNKKAKEATNMFLDSYLFNGVDLIEELFISREHTSHEEFDMSIKTSTFRREGNTIEYQRREELLEQKVQDICFSNHVVSSYLLIISNLLISLDKDNENKNKALKLLAILYRGKIIDLLEKLMNDRLTSTGEVSKEFFEELERLEDLNSLDFDQNEGDGKKTYFPIADKSDLLINISQLQYINSNSDSQNYLTTWKPEKQRVFRKNLNAYGRSFVLDRNEMFYMMKSSYYASSYINSFISILGKFNLEMSLIDSERYLISNIHDQFAFISSLGHDGFLGSSHDKIPTSIKQASKELNYGFSFFTLVGGRGTKIRKKEFSEFKNKLIDKVGSLAALLWNSIKHDVAEYNQAYIDVNGVVGKLFGQKLCFFKTIFHNMIYLGGLEHSEIETFEGGSHSRDYSNEKPKRDSDVDEEMTKHRIVNISADIITKLEELLYYRTRFRSDLPTEELLLENMLEFVPIFMNNVIENQILTESQERLDTCIIEVAKNLRYILDYKDDKYYDSVVLIYEQLLKVLDDKFEIKGLYRMKESIVIKKMMAKITQSNCTESQFLSTLKFMIAYSSTSEGALHLFEERVIPALIASHCLKNLDDHEYYEIKERNTKHILWLWTLHLMRQLTMMLIQNSEFTYTLINFIVSFEKRIMSSLQFKGYIDGKKQFKSFSIARLEEIEHIVNLMAFCLQSYDQWKDQNSDQVDWLVNILFSYTVNLFQSNVALNDCFHPISQFEKYINSLSEQGEIGVGSRELGDTDLINQSSAGSFSSISQTDRNFMRNKVVTSLRTPMKGETSEKSFKMLENDQYAKRAYKSSSLVNYMADKYRPNAFILKVEVTLSKIALMMLRCMHLILKEEIKIGSRSDFIKQLSFYHEVNNETRIFLICSNIFDVIQFSLHCQGKWANNFEGVKKLNKVLNGAYLSSENTMDTIIDMEDVLQISQSTTELGLMLSMMLLKASQLSKEESLDKNYLEIADQRLVNKINSFTEEWRRLKAENEEVSPKKMR